VRNKTIQKCIDLLNLIYILSTHRNRRRIRYVKKALQIQMEENDLRIQSITLAKKK